MADTTPNSRRDETLLSISTHHFGYAAQLMSAKIAKRLDVDDHACSKDEGCRKPTPWCVIENDATPGPGDCADPYPHRDPQWDQNPVGIAAPSAPEDRKGVDHQPNDGIVE